MDPRELYQEMILEHNKKPRNFGVIADANRHAEGHNPVCGDHITLHLHLEGEQIQGVSFEGHSCAGQSSTKRLSPSKKRAANLDIC